MNTENINIEYVTTEANEDITLTLPKNDYFAILMINTDQVSPSWRNQLCEQIVYSKRCIQAMVTGHECSIWDDVLDETYVAFYNNEPPINTCFMTTWHENETLDEVIEFAKIGMQLESISKLIIIQIE
ncbi:DUF7684 family protein [Acinetobacter haemolyticus]|uniref:DUF7684 domain-containing protein n=1 Tax=Acinetobacter haemolyticus TaxID=29430 RepID=A0AAW4J0S3_ACIHA|nr:hypothetical protein [Acinetobacter haemolyticus]MBO3656507.1 hypothetical protein [Acinetobacter haemolyticus]